MRTGMIKLVMAMAVGTVMSAACDSQEQRTVIVPEASKAAPNTKPTSSVPNVALGTPTAAERATPPVQGQVDPKESPQRRDFEQRK